MICYPASECHSSSAMVVAYAAWLGYRHSRGPGPVLHFQESIESDWRPGPMAKTRICFVGGGSYQWTPKLMTDIALMKDLSGTIVLHDIAPEPMAEMQKLGQKIMQQAGADFTVETGGDLAEALKGAEFVIVTI